MKIGFVTFCTENYINILNNLVDSVLFFSKYDLYVYAINFDYISKSDRIKVKKIEVTNTNYFNICKMKIFSTIDCPLNVGLILDCDMIVTDQIDNIFDENINKIVNSDFPLFAKHPHKPLESNFGYLNTFKKYTNKTPKMNWVYASFMFSEKNKWFLKKVLEEMDKLTNQIGEDELIINALLTEYEVNYDIGYNYLPNGTNNLFNFYLNKELNSNELYETYLKHNCPVKFFTFHGHECKNYDNTKKFLTLLKNI